MSGLINSTWIEADVWIPDEVARTMYLQKLDTTKVFHIFRAA